MPPRHDGLFIHGTGPDTSIVRFLEDGTVLVVSTMGKDPLHEVLGWLKPKKDLRPATIELDGDKIAWVDSGMVEYRGTWAEDHLVLDMVSRLNGYRSEGQRFDFTSAESIEAQRAERAAKRAAGKQKAKPAATKKPAAKRGS